MNRSSRSALPTVLPTATVIQSSSVALTKIDTDGIIDVRPNETIPTVYEVASMRMSTTALGAFCFHCPEVIGFDEASLSLDVSPFMAGHLVALYDDALNGEIIDGEVIETMEIEHDRIAALNTHAGYSL